MNKLNPYTGDMTHHHWTRLLMSWHSWAVTKIFNQKLPKTFRTQCAFSSKSLAGVTDIKCRLILNPAMFYIEYLHNLELRHITEGRPHKQTILLRRRALRKQQLNGKRLLVLFFVNWAGTCHQPSTDQRHHLAIISQNVSNMSMSLLNSLVTKNVRYLFKLFIKS